MPSEIMNVNGKEGCYPICPEVNQYLGIIVIFLMSLRTSYQQMRLSSCVIFVSHTHAQIVLTREDHTTLFWNYALNWRTDLHNNQRKLTPTEGRQQASSQHPCLRRSGHTLGPEEHQP
jgi:hypothetical protein